MAISKKTPESPKGTKPQNAMGGSVCKATTGSIKLTPVSHNCKQLKPTGCGLRAADKAKK